MMNVLVTGSSGLTGSEVVDFFKNKGANVIGIDANLRSYFFGVESQTPELNIDIRNEEAINNLFESNKFDVIVHCAAQPSHDWSKDHVLEDFDINARGTLILLEATRKYCPNTTFIHVSTDKVYGEGMKRSYLREKGTRYSSILPFSEKTKFGPKYSPFGISKLSSDLYAQEYSSQGWIKNVGIFRPGCITGSRHKGAEYHGFMAYLVKCIKEGITYRIFGYKGKQVRDQIHAYDLASAFWEFAQAPRELEIYNIGGGPKRSTSILEAISLVEKETGKKAITEYIDEPRQGDRQWDVHDVRKFRSHYPNWEYKYNLSDIIKEVCQ